MRWHVVNSVAVVSPLRSEYGEDYVSLPESDLQKYTIFKAHTCMVQVRR